MNRKSSCLAKATSKDQFEGVIEANGLKAFISRKGRNEKIVNDFMSNADMRAVIIGALLEKVYRQARGL